MAMNPDFRGHEPGVLVAAIPEFLVTASPVTENVGSQNATPSNREGRGRTRSRALPLECR